MTESALADGGPAARSETVDAPSVPAPDPATDLWPRVLGRVCGPAGTPTLVCLGGVHGNEPAGVLALRRIFAALARDTTGLVGEVVGLTGNRKALRAGRRFLDYDLNRAWSPDRVARLRAAEGPLRDEDEELRGLDRALNEVMERARGEVLAVDLHTTSGRGPAFVVLDDTLGNRGFAIDVPVTLVVGIEEELSGTVPHHLIEMGVRVFGFEAGQHEDPRAVDQAEAAVWIAMETSGVIEPGSRPEVASARRLLEQLSAGLPHVVEVRHRHPVSSGDGFRMREGFVNFQPVERGEVMASDLRGQIETPVPGMVLMPLYQSQGGDGFFIVRPLDPMWLRLSAVVRRGRFERILPFLPGVRRHPELPDTFIADQRWARWGALELFHLLGYRRTGPRSRFLTMTRRNHDL